MAIETRGHDNILVVSGSAVPVEDIANSVIERKKLDWICNRFPVTVDEVFECIDTIADNAPSASFKGGITLYNTGSPDDMQIETISVNDTVYFSLISYGHTLDPAGLDFDIIYNKGLVGVIKDIYTDLAQNADYFESSDLHSCVYDSILAEIGHVDAAQVLESLTGES